MVIPPSARMVNAAWMKNRRSIPALTNPGITSVASHWLNVLVGENSEVAISSSIAHETQQLNYV